MVVSPLSNNGTNLIGHVLIIQNRRRHVCHVGNTPTRQPPSIPHPLIDLTQEQSDIVANPTIRSFQVSLLAKPLQTI
jgi:hypothetical protein